MPEGPPRCHGRGLDLGEERLALRAHGTQQIVEPGHFSPIPFGRVAADEQSPAILEIQLSEGQGLGQFFDHRIPAVKGSKAQRNLLLKHSDPGLELKGVGVLQRHRASLVAESLDRRFLVGEHRQINKHARQIGYRQCGESLDPKRIDILPLLTGPHFLRDQRGWRGVQRMIGGELGQIGLSSGGSIETG